MTLAEKLNEDLKDAMRRKDSGRLRALRAIKSALLLAQTEKGASDVTPDTEIKIIQKLVKQRKESFDIFQQQNREDLADKEAEEIAVLEEYLPEQMSEEQVKEEIAKIIVETGASSPKDMGKVMGVASKKLAGKADSKTIGTIAKQLLEP